jgi:hypothetical protein
MRDKQESAEQASKQTDGGTAANVDTANQFRAHLANASKVVQTWPVWKQRVLGGAVVQPPTTPPQTPNCLQG